MFNSEGRYSVEEFIIAVQAVEGSLISLVTELQRNTIGGQGCAVRLAGVSKAAHHLSEIAQDGHINFP